MGLEEGKLKRDLPIFALGNRDSVTGIWRLELEIVLKGMGSYQN